MPQQYVSVKVIAEDFVGFDGTSSVFDIVIMHRLNATQTELTVEVIAGEKVGYTLPMDTTLMDRLPIQKAYIQSIAVTSLPPWLAFDGDRRVLQGKAPKGAESEKITLEVRDIYLITVTVTIEVAVTLNGIFTQDIGSLSITKGESFTSPSTLPCPTYLTSH